MGDNRVSVSIMVKGVVQDNEHSSEYFTTGRFDAPQDVTLKDLQDSLLSLQENLIKVNSTEKHPLIIKHVVITLTYD